MAYFAGSLTGEAAVLKRRLKIGVTHVEGKLVVRDDNGPGFTKAPGSKTAAVDFIGVTLEAGTYSTTQGTDPSAEVLVDTTYNPFGIYAANITGGTDDTNDTALSITENDTAETAGTTIIDGDLPADSMLGGLVYGLTGANAGQSRVFTTNTASGNSVVVTVPFDSDIVSGAQFLVFADAPFITSQITLSTNFTQVSQWHAQPSGAEFAVLDIVIDDTSKSSPTARMFFVSRDSYFNPIA